MKRFNVRVAIYGSRDLGIMEANDDEEIFRKVREEDLTFEGVSDDVIDLLNLGRDETFVEEIIENEDSRCPICKRECEPTDFLCGEDNKFVMNAYSCDKCNIIFGGKND